ILLRGDALPMLFHLRCFLGLGRGSSLCFLLRQGTGMHDDKSELLLAYVPIRILHGDAPEDTLAPPTAGSILLGTARFVEEDGERGLLAAPCLQFLPYGTRAGHACH